MLFEVDTEIEPPGLDTDGDDGDEPCIGVHCAMGEVDDTRRAGFVHLAADSDDDTIAAAMVAAMLGTAAMRGPELLAALQARLRPQGG